MEHGVGHALSIRVHSASLLAAAVERIHAAIPSTSADIAGNISEARDAA